MRVSREQAAENRDRIVDVAAKLFRERGFDGVGVADLMKTAGLTHGGFYGHFNSKEALMAEACERAIQSTGRRWQKLTGNGEGVPLEQLTRRYLCKRHRDAPGDGCVLAALGNDASRQSAPVRRAYTASVQRFIGLLESALPGRVKEARRRKAVAACATMVGALMLSRAVNDDTLAEEILESATRQLLDRP